MRGEGATFAPFTFHCSTCNLQYLSLRVSPRRPPARLQPAHVAPGTHAHWRRKKRPYVTRNVFRPAHVAPGPPASGTPATGARRAWTSRLRRACDRCTSRLDLPPPARLQPAHVAPGPPASGAPATGARRAWHTRPPARLQPTGNIQRNTRIATRMIAMTRIIAYSTRRSTSYSVLSPFRVLSKPINASVRGWSRKR